MNELIDINVFYNCLILGCEKIFCNRELLNSYNGFPVADKDTGNNLSYLMKNIALNIKKEERIDKLLEKVSYLSIKFSRGNSGAIFSQFLNGFYKKAPNSQVISVEDLSNCFSSGCEYAYKSVDIPKEGTILSVIRTFSSKLKQSTNEIKNVFEHFNYAYNFLSEDVENTKNILEAQKKLKNPDAGAMAFLFFIEGFIEAIKNGKSQVSNYKIFEDNLELEFSDNHYFSSVEEINIDIVLKFC